MTVMRDASARLISRSTDLLTVIVERARHACFVDLIVGVVLFGWYGVQIWYHQPVDLWPLVTALGITRGGDAVKAFAKGNSNAGQTYPQKETAWPSAFVPQKVEQCAT